MRDEWVVAYQARVARRAADHGDWELPTRSLPASQVPLEVPFSFTYSSDTASESTTGLEDSGEKASSCTGLAPATLGALLLVPRLSSPR